MLPLVSILIPAYNAERWIAETLHSAANQTWSRKEIIVVDDGSRDQTAAIARGFSSATIKVITQANAGASVARSTALEHAQGDFIQWLDADDLLSPNKIESQMIVLQKLGNYRLLPSCPWGHFIYRSAHTKFSPTALWEDLDPLEWVTRQMEQNLHMQTATWLVSRELTAAAGPWDPRLAACASDDGEYFCRVVLASDGTRFVHDAKVHYRMPTSRNLSYIGLSSKKMDTQALALNLYINHVRARDDSVRVRAAAVQFLQNWLHHFYPHRPDLVEKIGSLACELGGKLKSPQFSWKYAWIQKTLGWDYAKRASLLGPNLRWGLIRAWDRALYSIANKQVVWVTA